MSEETIRLERDDVTVEAVYDYCEDCTETSDGRVYAVVIDFRSAGMTERIGRYCLACAEVVAERIRNGLPARGDGQ